MHVSDEIERAFTLDQAADLHRRVFYREKTTIAEGADLLADT
jgi:hypothetical protein